MPHHGHMDLPISKVPGSEWQLFPKTMFGSQHGNVTCFIIFGGYSRHSQD